MRIPSRKTNRIVMIDVTQRCDLRCSNCTRALAQHARPDMTLEQFETAVVACKDWIIRERGTLAIFGGNPCVSPLFADYARILAEHLPEERRGLWTNRLMGKGDVVRRHFGPRSYLNLVVHGSSDAAAEMRAELPWKPAVHGEDRSSKHASVFVAARDFLPEDEIWRRVAHCTYDIEWSAIVVQEAPRWEHLGGYSCEIASTHARVMGMDLGVEVKPGWLDLLLPAFEHQYRFACPRCSGCLNLKGVPDHEERDQFSESNRVAMEATVSRVRKVEMVTALPPEDTRPPIAYLKE